VTHSVRSLPAIPYSHHKQQTARPSAFAAASMAAAFAGRGAVVVRCQHGAVPS